jgi:hypothetical protein
MPDSKGMNEQDVSPAGEYSAWASPDGMKAEVRTSNGRVAKRLTGESAWSDAARLAGDLNIRVN